MHRVLFIGNSHTYLHRMPLIAAGLAGICGFDVQVAQATGEGAGLAWHWENRTTRDKLESGGWTHVVLQERSRGPLEDRPSMFRHARLFDREIRRLDARTVFYMTWAAREKPEDQSIIAEAYETIALECRACLAPVGRAWEIVKGMHPGMELHHRDGRHAGKAGAYLAACVFCGILSGGVPRQTLSGRLSSGGRTLVNLSEDTAGVLQRAAIDALRNPGESHEGRRHGS
ncbi:MAG: hypothetical protein LJE94_01355 [Deltaproteobacteria bacterium]|nr:hypothetical protein [Deltaproteobacteria bacterium]